MLNIQIDQQSAGKRLDTVVADLFPRLSQTYVRTLIEGERVVVNGTMQKGGYKLRLGDTVSTDFEESELETIADIQLPVVYEDENLFVVDKPAGVISHSRGRYWYEPSVASFVRQHLRGTGERGAIVNRLDRATSGVMLCGKNQKSLAYLQKQFAERKVSKTYFAITNGVLEQSTGIISLPIGRDLNSPSRFEVCSAGKEAVTLYRVVEQRGEYQYLQLEPQTGRTHQLRVHLAAMGHPIVGDALYGGLAHERLMLHAGALEISVPGGKRQVFTAPLPQCFSEIGNE